MAEIIKPAGPRAKLRKLINEFKSQEQKGPENNLSFGQGTYVIKANGELEKIVNELNIEVEEPLSESSTTPSVEVSNAFYKPEEALLGLDENDVSDIIFLISMTTLNNCYAVVIRNWIHRRK